MSWKFIHPFTARFVGPSACGKTTFLKQVIDQKLILPWPEEIIYFYGSEWQGTVFDDLKNKNGVSFIPGFDENILKEKSGKSGTLVICDDLILEMKDSEAAANIFMRGSHHMNMSVILIEQSLFPKGKQSVAMKQNCQYTVIFKSPSDMLAVSTFARQMFPANKGKFLVESFHDCTRLPFTYLIVDAKQNTPDVLRVVTQITDTSKHPLVYVCNSKNLSNVIDAFNCNIDS